MACSEFVTRKIMEGFPLKSCSMGIFILMHHTSLYLASLPFFIPFKISTSHTWWASQSVTVRFGLESFWPWVVSYSFGELFRFDFYSVLLSR